MTLQEFEDLLDLYGGKVEDWPEAKRDAASAILADSAAARRAITVIREVEEHLASTKSRDDDMSFVATRAMARRQIPARAKLFTKLGWSAAAAALLLLGVFLGSDGERYDDPSLTLARAMASVEVIDVD